MTTSITSSIPVPDWSNGIQPLLVDGWQEASESRNIVNPVLGGGVDVTLQNGALRTGSFILVFQDEQSAAEAFTLLTDAATFTLTDDDRPSISLQFVVSGTLERSLDDATREFWTINVPYQEV